MPSADLARLGWTTDDYVELLWSLSRAPDADIALRTMVRLADALGPGFEELNAALLKDRCLRGRLFALLGSSLALGDHLVANPQTWQLLQGSVSLPTVDELRREFLDCVAETPDQRNAFCTAHAVPEPIDGARGAGCRAHGGKRAGAAVRDHRRASVRPRRRRAHRARSRWRWRASANKERRPRLAVIAMGKCGARELNYVSDVDVIFVGETADALEIRVAGETMRLASEVFFEVDAALRPEGRHGALVRTLESHVSYYKRWAKTWEFQALLKARFAAGDAELGEQYVSALMPMVWTASEREDFVTEVQAMRRRVEELVPADVRDRELKLGTGGLRDVEFAVQLLQLVHGRHDESLHVSSTVDALRALGAGGYVGRDDTANLTASYEFLRLLEHRLQLQRLKRTHMLPRFDDDEAMRWLARAAHIRPDGHQDAVGVLREELKRQNMRVSRLHAKLFYQPLLESIGSGVGLAAWHEHRGR